MCWNPDISINTFLLGALTLVFVYYTNTYTKYKTPTFDNMWYFKDRTWGTMWCWSSNLMWIYFIIRITIYLPFLEYNKLC